MLRVLAAAFVTFVSVSVCAQDPWDLAACRAVAPAGHLCTPEHLNADLAALTAQRDRRATDAGTISDPRTKSTELGVLRTFAQDGILELGEAAQRSIATLAAAEFNVGEEYYDGKDAPRDYVQAAVWYRKAADHGHAASQYNLGMMYINGQGVPQDDTEAVIWLRKAAEQGIVYAQFFLGLSYANGVFVSQDYAQAVLWYRKAAEQGHAEAQYNLGTMYLNGRGVVQDYLEAHIWANLAAARATGQDQKRYADGRDALARRMTPSQLAEAQRRAQAWVPSVSAVAATYTATYRNPSPASDTVERSSAPTASLRSPQGAPLPQSLRAARLVYLEQGAGIDRATIDRAAKEIQKYKPRRLEVVGDKDQADLIIALADVSSGPGGVLLAPIAGLGVVGVPVRDTTYRLTVRSRISQELLWDDRRTDLGRLVKDFLKRLTSDADTRAGK